MIVSPLDGGRNLFMSLTRNLQRNLHEAYTTLKYVYSSSLRPQFPAPPIRAFPQMGPRKVSAARSPAVFGFQSGPLSEEAGLYARPLAISISTLMNSRPSDSNGESRTLTSSRTSRRSASGSARYACGIDPIPASIGSQ